MTYTFTELFSFFIIYSFLGWVVEVSIVAVKDRRFRNRGFVNLPFCTMYGVMMSILITIWPYMQRHGVYKFIVAFAVFVVVESFSEVITNRICNRMVLKYEDITPYNGQWMNLLVAVLFAVGLWAITELIHPFVYFMVDWIPELILKIFCFIVGTGIFFDFTLTLYTMLRNCENINDSVEQDKQYKLNRRIYEKIWTRLNNAYPNIEKELTVEKHVFAEGICFDKLVWVFGVSALLGDVIETFYCRAL